MTQLVVSPADAMDGSMLALAHELATDINPLPEVLKNHGISAAHWERLQENPRFQQLLQSKIVEWNSAANTVERLKIKYAASLELSAPTLHQLMNSEEVSPRDKLEISKYMAGFVNGGRGGGGLGDGPGTGGFNLTIQISGREPLVINTPVEAPRKVIEVEE